MMIVQFSFSVNGYVAVISDYPSLQSTIIAIIPARIPAASPSARIAIGKAAELGVTDPDPEAEVEPVAVELVTTLGVVDEVEGVDADAETDAVTEMPLEVDGVTDGVVIEPDSETLGIDVEIGIKPETDVDDVLSMLSVNAGVSDEVAIEDMGVSNVVDGSCGLAETDNTEKRRVIETAKMVDFIIV